MNSVTEWVASIPVEVSPREGIALINVALADAKEATAKVVADYKGGTLPPPPWPQPPELVKAIDALEGGLKMLNWAVSMGYGDTKEPHTGAHAVRLINGGRMLYAGIEKMEKDHREGVVNVENIPKLAQRAALAVLPTGVGGLLAIGFVLWLLSEGDE